ncbi:MAG: hypothetical protein Q9177_000263 [Variospora cf. flavescens]
MASLGPTPTEAKNPFSCLPPTIFLLRIKMPRPRQSGPQRWKTNLSEEAVSGMHEDARSFGGRNIVLPPALGV